MRFEWDPRKARINLRKHGVSFDEARSVFADRNALLWADPAHSDSEDRFAILGMSSSRRMLFVYHSYRADDLVRIFSARKATRGEIRNYF